MYSFVDYIKGGCQISLITALDFTVSASLLQLIVVHVHVQFYVLSETCTFVTRTCMYGYIIFGFFQASNGHPSDPSSLHHSTPSQVHCTVKLTFVGTVNKLNNGNLHLGWNFKTNLEPLILSVTYMYVRSVACTDLTYMCAGFHFLVRLAVLLKPELHYAGIVQWTLTCGMQRLEDSFLNGVIGILIPALWLTPGCFFSIQTGVQNSGGVQHLFF